MRSSPQPTADHRIGRTWLALLLATMLFSMTQTAEASTITPVRWVTKSGMVVLFIEHHSLPTIHLQLLIKAGSSVDPKGEEGSADLVASLLDEGTTTRSSQQIAEAIDFIGASLTAGASPDATTISLNVLKKDLPTGMDLFSDELLHPSFPQNEIDRVRQQILGGLVAEEDDPDAVAGKAWQELIYGSHPYHHPTEGYPGSLPAISRDKLVDFHQHYYQPRNAILAVVGNLTRAELEQLLTRYLGEWKNRPQSEPTTLPPPSPVQPTVKLIDKELTQATIMMGHIGIARGNPDYYAVSVMNYILGGGGFSSRLVSRIRDNQGLAYSVYSSFHPLKAGGSFSVGLQTKNTSANRAIAEAVDTITQLQHDGVTAQELDEAKAYLIGSFPLKLDTDAKLVGTLTSIEFNQLGLDYLDRYPKLIRVVTLADVKRVAARYLRPDRMVLVVVAKQAEAQISTPTSGP
jgi:zinc protease